MIDSNTENTKFVSSGHKGTFFNGNHSSIKLAQRTVRLGRISQDNKHKTRKTGSAQLTMTWCSNAGNWAVVLLMRGNGWLARWSWWLISILEPYHKGSQRYESDPCICDVQIWGLLKKHWQTSVEATATDCFCCLLLITVHTGNPVLILKRSRDRKHLTEALQKRNNTLPLRRSGFSGVGPNGLAWNGKQ